MNRLIDDTDELPLLTETVQPAAGHRPLLTVEDGGPANAPADGYDPYNHVPRDRPAGKTQRASSAARRPSHSRASSVRPDQA